MFSTSPGKADKMTNLQLTPQQLSTASTQLAAAGGDASIGRYPPIAQPQQNRQAFGAISAPVPTPVGTNPQVNDSLVATLQSLQSIANPPLLAGASAAVGATQTDANMSAVLNTNRLLESLQVQQLGGVGLANPFQLSALSPLTAAPVAGLHGQLHALTSQLQDTNQGQPSSTGNFGNISQLLSSQGVNAPPIQLQLTDTNSVLDQMLGNAAAQPLGEDPLRSLVAQATASGAQQEEKIEEQGSVTSSPSRRGRPVADVVAAAAASQVPSGSATEEGTPPICLYVDGDDSKISAYQCLARQQIELFAATDDDVQFNTSKMNKMIVAGQVGIRCRHCAVLPQYSRPKAAVYYPRTLDSLYQFGQNMVKNHLGASCKLIPEATRKKMEDLKDARRRGRGGREHWALSAKALGVYEDANGLRFR